MIGYSTKLDWHGGPDQGWRVELLKDGERFAYMSLDEWKSLGAGVRDAQWPTDVSRRRTFQSQTEGSQDPPLPPRILLICRFAMYQVAASA